MNIRTATTADFSTLYEIGKNIPEFRVSTEDIFMDADEFADGITNPNDVFLVAEENNAIIGFIWAEGQNTDKHLETKTSCIVYITILPKYRNQGIAQKLYQECESKLKEKGVQNL